MTHDVTYDEMIVVLEALRDGKEVQYRSSINEAGAWRDRVSTDCPNFSNWTYRIKPQPREWFVSVKDNCLFTGTVTGMEHITVREVLEEK